jgi:very-short-patch-repair endonuclease
MTDAERLLWRSLREKLPQHHWRKQVPIGPYITDFACHAAKLIIELDGGQHATANEESRTNFIKDQGFRLIRFWNSDVIENTDGVLMTIESALTPSPTRGIAAHPSPAGRVRL